MSELVSLKDETLVSNANFPRKQIEIQEEKDNSQLALSIVIDNQDEDDEVESTGPTMIF